MQQLQLSNEALFRRAAKKAILSIVLFVVSYIVLLTLSIGLVFLCGWLGILVMSLVVNVATIGLGVGSIAMGIIIFIFLIKFVFKKHVVDRSHLVELEESDAPMLYEDIRKLVDQVHTTFPKRIYLSHEVNAAVFYDSTFLSMFFPVKKNLQIGLALVNSVTRAELKSILAHEFGHFSQKSMKVGSYVYSVNQIIFNLVAENEDFHNTIQGFGRISNYFVIFTFLGLKIITGIQWLLKKLYGIVNINHLGLSRQMEFHADAVAAGTVGTAVFKNALLRLDLANNAYDQVLSYYDQKIPENIRPLNVYPQQFFVMNFFAKEANIDIVNNFPKVTLANRNRYNRSKLVIKDQWASHPSTEDRIEAIEAYHFEEGNDDGAPATGYFKDIAALQSKVTTVLFSHVNFNGNPVADNFDQFTEGFLANRKGIKFPTLFNGYYDNHNPIKIDLTAAMGEVADFEFENL
jgi:Zn-dependent protease with chaperone function